MMWRDFSDLGTATFKAGQNRVGLDSFGGEAHNAC